MKMVQVSPLWVATLLLVPRLVMAGEGDNSYESDRRGSVSFGGGQYVLTDDPEISTVYGKSAFGDLQVMAAWMPLRLLRVDVGLDLFRGEAAQVPADVVEDSEDYDAETSTSADVESLKVGVASLGGTLRLDVLDEQFLVPYVRGGMSYLIFSHDGADPVNTFGDKQGYYYGGGVEILLDKFEPDRAADLDISHGINDIYLTIEGRRHIMEEEGGFNFSAQAMGLGLRFDF